MKWTRAKPTAPGFYWFREEGGRHEPVEIKDDESVLFLGSDMPCPPDHWELEGGEWAGPLPEPTE